MQTQLLSILAVLAVAAFAASATAATSVTVVAASGNTTTANAVITLETYVTADAGEMDDSVLGRITWTVGLIVPRVHDSTNGTQNALPGFQLGSLQCTTGNCLMIRQATLGAPVAINLSNFLITTQTYVVAGSAAPGSVIQFSWQTTPSSQRLDWFGQTSAPGVSITVVVPEPTTGALLAAGLLGLVAKRRRS